MEKTAYPYDYNFYLEYLKQYENIQSETGFVKLDTEQNILFGEFNSSYSESCEVPADERSDENITADSFAFFRSTGVIEFKENNWYINLKKLAEVSKSYETALAGINNGTAKTMGSHK